MNPGAGRGPDAAFLGLFLTLLMAGQGLPVAGRALVAGEAPERAELGLGIRPGQAMRYDWTIQSVNRSKGREAGKPLNVKIEKTIGLLVDLCGQKPQKAGELPVLLRFPGFRLDERREVGEDLRSELKIGDHKVLLKENEKVLIDSQNDIGLDKITDYQREMRDLEKGEIALTLDSTGRPSRPQRQSDLLGTLQGGLARTLFPVLPGRTVQVAETWDDRYEVSTLGEIELEQPASVLSRVRLAEFKRQEGRRLALLDVLFTWETRDVAGTNEKGLSVKITELEGHGGGVCTFDPEGGRFLDGNILFKMRYHIVGQKEGESTELDVDGRTEIGFRLQPQGRSGPEAPVPQR